MLFKMLLLTGMLFCLLSCKKTDDNEPDSRIEGRYYDPELVGAWTMNYSARDQNNEITNWTDSIYFEENNVGKRQTYRFLVLEKEVSFLYYTNRDSLFLIQDDVPEKWIYNVNNDSLFLETSQPGYSSYHEFRVYKKSE